MQKESLLLVLFISCLFNSLFARQVTIRELLTRTDKAVSALNEGRYILHDHYSKISLGEDSSARNATYRCYFNKLFNDTLVGYKLTALREDGYERVYNGNELLELSGWNKTLEVTYRNRFPEKIKKLQHDYFIFPFFKFLHRAFLQNNTDSTINRLQIAGLEDVNGVPCYKLQQPVKDQAGNQGNVSYYYISSTTFLPVRWYVQMVTVVGQSRTIQTFDYFITDLHTEKNADNLFTKTVLSRYDRMKDYDPDNDKPSIQLLAAGTQAPQWELPLVNGGVLKLSELKGKIVIMDFWYKACTPCQKQMTDLETISKQFDKDKVVFVGVNTTDDPVKEKLALFLKNRNISMLSVHNGKTIEKLYQVSASPALFVIDKEGKIIFNQDGVSYTLADDLPRIINGALTGK